MSFKKSKISWNQETKLIISDVDETVADLYVEAEPDIHTELIKLLKEGVAIFFVTGQGLKSVQWRIIDHIPQRLRSKILVGHCSGAEVWGHNKQGVLLEKPFYSIYKDAMNSDQKKIWRDLVNEVIAEFNLKVFPTMSIPRFLKEAGNDSLSIMFEDRGSQITFEVVNGYDLTPDQADVLEKNIPETHGNYDLRIPILEFSEQLFEKFDLPISPKLGGVFAVDFVVKGVSKTTSVKHVLEDEVVLRSLGLNKEILKNPNNIEIWGDKFSVIRGGTDRHMSEALPKEVRSIDFREENSEEFMEGYNIEVWDGMKHLHHGLLEYMQSRHK